MTNTNIKLVLKSKLSVLPSNWRAITWRGNLHTYIIVCHLPKATRENLNAILFMQQLRLFLYQNECCLFIMHQLWGFFSGCTLTEMNHQNVPKLFRDSFHIVLFVETENLPRKPQSFSKKGEAIPACTWFIWSDNGEVNYLIGFMIQYSAIWEFSLFCRDSTVKNYN